MTTPPPLTPLTPLVGPTPLTPAQQRARRAEQRAFIRREQEAGRLPVAPPHLRPFRRDGERGAPAGKRFHAYELRRVPVELSDDARRLILASSAQGRLLPQALSELLGTHSAIARVRVAVEEKSRRFIVHPAEVHPPTGGPPLLLAIVAEHVSDDARLAHEWLINAADLSDLHPRTHQPLFNPALMAQELLRLYPHPPLDA